jgi:hypothetical protein
LLPANPQYYREGALACVSDAGELEAGMKVLIGKELPLSAAGQAYRLLEAGETAGSVLFHSQLISFGYLINMPNT